MFGGTRLKAEFEFDLLGVSIDSKLSYHSHITGICRNINGRLVCLRRLMSILGKAEAIHVYKAYVRSVFEYAPIVWMSANKSHLQKLDVRQRKAFRIMGLDPTDVEKHKLYSPSFRRRVCALENLYRLQQSSCPEFLRHLCPEPMKAPTRPTRSALAQQPHALQVRTLCSRERRVTRNQGNRLFDTDQYLRSFLPTSVADWNSLPASVVREISDSGGDHKLDRNARKAFVRRVVKHYLADERTKHSMYDHDV